MRSAKFTPSRHCYLNDEAIAEFKMVGNVLVQFGSSETWRIGADQTTTFIDAMQGVTHLTYDASGHLASVTNPLQHVIERRRFDDQGRLIEQANALNQSTQVSYDSVGRVASLTSLSVILCSMPRPGASPPTAHPSSTSTPCTVSPN